MTDRSQPNSALVSRASRPWRLHHNRNVDLMLIVCAVSLLFGCDSTNANRARREGGSTDRGELSSAISSSRPAASGKSRQAGGALRDEKIDFTQTSWEDPFTAAHWQSAGWSFDGSSMSCAVDEEATATFGRSYKKPMVQMKIGVPAEPSSFDVLFVSGGDETVTRISLTSERVIVTAEVPRRAKRVIKSGKLDPPLSSAREGELRVAATGNRVLVFWNSRRVLTCAQPVEQSGRDLKISLSSPSGCFRISEMRIEGE